jgi:hypothetical protein
MTAPHRVPGVNKIPLPLPGLHLPNDPEILRPGTTGHTHQ